MPQGYHEPIRPFCRTGAQHASKYFCTVARQPAPPRAHPRPPVSTHVAAVAPQAPTMASVALAHSQNPSVCGQRKGEDFCLSSAGVDIVLRHGV
jgi:hypothetical protein